MRENIQSALVQDSTKSGNSVKKVGVYDRPEHSGPSKTAIIITLVIVATVITLVAKYVF